MVAWAIRRASTPPPPRQHLGPGPREPGASPTASPRYRCPASVDIPDRQRELRDRARRPWGAVAGGDLQVLHPHSTLVSTLLARVQLDPHFTAWRRSFDPSLVIASRVARQPRSPASLTGVPAGGGRPPWVYPSTRHRQSRGAQKPSIHRGSWPPIRSRSAGCSAAPEQSLETVGVLDVPRHVTTPLPHGDRGQSQRRPEAGRRPRSRPVGRNWRQARSPPTPAPPHVGCGGLDSRPPATSSTHRRRALDHRRPARPPATSSPEINHLRSTTENRPRGRMAP